MHLPPRICDTVAMRVPRRTAAALLLASVAALAPGRAGAQATAYDFAPTAVEGSAREVGIGGATVASPKDYSAVFINPAGLGGLAGDGIDFGSDSNSIDNFIVDPSDPRSKALNDPLRFSFFGFRYVTSRGWGFGAAAQAPYDLDDTFAGTAKTPKGSKLRGQQDQTEIKAQTHIYTLAAARSFFDKKLSVGAAVNYIKVHESYDFTPVFTTTSPVHLAADRDAFSGDLGLLGEPWPWLQLGAVYKMGWHASFDSSLNDGAIGTAGTVNAFRNGKSPDRVELGLRWHPNKHFSFMAQTNYRLAMKNTAVVGSGLFPGSSGQLLSGQSNSIDGHWGVEVVPIDEPGLTFKMWAGGYLEDTGLQGGFRRYHRTAGVGFSPWFWSLSMAVDDASLYNNFTVGLGIDLLEAASRVSKRMDWKLPL